MLSSNIIVIPVAVNLISKTAEMDPNFFRSFQMNCDDDRLGSAHVDQLTAHIIILQASLWLTANSAFFLSRTSKDSAFIFNWL